MKGNKEKFRDEVRPVREHPADSKRTKKFNFMIILPKNYFRIIEVEYDYIISQVSYPYFY